MKDFTELRGASYAREFYERAISKIAERFEDMDEICLDAIGDMDQFEVDLKNKEAYENTKAKIEDLRLELLSFIDSFLQRH